jgi:hypothetical protein
MSRLPAELVAFLRDAATREDGTISGQVRHLVAQAAPLRCRRQCRTLIRIWGMGTSLG